MSLPEADIKKIIERIENKFPGSAVVWIGSGSPDQDFSDNSEMFEALKIEDRDYEEFVNFTWELELDIKEKTGYSLIVLAVNPENTMKFRKEVYEKRQNETKSVHCVTIGNVTQSNNFENFPKLAWAA
jgi:hypothetical protein